MLKDDKDKKKNKKEKSDKDKYEEKIKVKTNFDDTLKALLGTPRKKKDKK